ncbi:unnamed protein product [Cuscuta epithymum]|uniref:SWIM-type domain-containing protein n=1 Tax=Cuscuta epithymum TaxID=186058 RepID=A0AAV0EHP4_9ASTE|nr:unnamed protein product [Cuscuta epithymum]
MDCGYSYWVVRRLSTWHRRGLGRDMNERSCSCRGWGLSGIPCKHAISAIYNQDEDPEDYVHECYTVEVYKSIYQHVILGINGEELWDKSNYIPPLPPNFGRGVGRPSKARRKEPDEPTSQKKKKSSSKTIVKLKRKQNTVKCKKCGVEGHNSATCEKRKQKGDKLKVRRKKNSPNIEVTMESQIESSSTLSNSGVITESETNVSNMYVPWDCLSYLYMLIVFTCMFLETGCSICFCPYVCFQVCFTATNS